MRLFGIFDLFKRRLGNGSGTRFTGVRSRRTMRSSAVLDSDGCTAGASSVF